MSTAEVDAAIEALNAGAGLAHFETWWRPRSIAINRLSVTRPQDFELIAGHVERFHERTKRALNRARDAAMAEVA